MTNDSSKHGWTHKTKVPPRIDFLHPTTSCKEHVVALSMKACSTPTHPSKDTCGETKYLQEINDAVSHQINKMAGSDNCSITQNNHKWPVRGTGLLQAHPSTLDTMQENTRTSPKPPASSRLLMNTASSFLTQTQPQTRPLRKRHTQQSAPQTHTTTSCVA